MKICIGKDLNSCQSEFVTGLVNQNVGNFLLLVQSFNSLIFLDNLVESEEGTHPGRLAVCSQESIHLVNHSRPFVWKIMP